MNCIICEKEVEHVRDTPDGIVYECSDHGLLLLRNDGVWSNEEELQRRLKRLKADAEKNEDVNYG